MPETPIASSENLQNETLETSGDDLDKLVIEALNGDKNPSDERTKDGLKNEGLKEPIISTPITVPYLSPLVLRKELENMLEREGDACLVDPNTGTGLTCAYRLLR